MNQAALELHKKANTYRLKSTSEQKTLDVKLNEFHREGWKLPRLDATMRAILRAGAFELQFCKDVPPAVTISEYVDVTKAFFEQEEAKFINGVLDRYARWVREGEMKPK